MCAPKALRALAAPDEPRFAVDPHPAHILPHSRRDGAVGERSIQEMVARFTAEALCLDFMGAWLMLVCCRGLSAADTLAMTLAMRDSGNIYNYLASAELGSASRRPSPGALDRREVPAARGSRVASRRDR